MAYYITTPLYYVNDLPHIGSAYPTMACDFFAGHMRQRGEDVCFLTGLDEHGQKIEKAAAANNKSPKEHCDFIAGEFQKLWQILEIDYDIMRRTSEDAHKNFVTEFFEKVRANGDIYKANYEGLYCVSCEDFKLEKDLEEIDGELCCPTHKQKVDNYSQENYFFKLSRYTDILREHIEKNPDFIYPENRKNEVLGWIKEGLRDFPISRQNIEWGIPVPGDDSGQKIYVWFDALLGYLSGLEDEGRAKFWQDGTIHHVIGKDILRFHAVYWPAMLLSAGYALPKKVFGHGFLTKDGMKMGKTLGNIIDPIDLAERYGADALRFYFMREFIFGRDGDFTEKTFIERLNADLANNLGNLLNRSLKLVGKYYDNKVPLVEINEEILQRLAALETSFTKSMDEMNPHQALTDLFKTLDAVNVLVNDTAPWKLLKEGPSQGAASCLVTAVEACRRAAILLAPLCPQLSKKIFQQLGLLAADDSRKLRELLVTDFSLQKFSAPVEYQLPDKLEPVFLRLEAMQTT